MKWLWEQSRRWTLLSSFLRERAVVVPLFLVGFVYLLLSLFNISIWRCPWKQVTGWRCPGCGLTTGTKAFFRGDFAEGLAMNWFTPFALVAFLMMPVMLAIPAKSRERALNGIQKVESATRLPLIFVIAVVVQIFFRLRGWA